MTRNDSALSDFFFFLHFLTSLDSEKEETRNAGERERQERAADWTHTQAATLHPCGM